MRPENWRHTRLAKLVEERSGLLTGPFGSQLHARDYTDDGVPVIMPKNLAGNVISTSDIARVPEQKADQLDRYRLKPGDLIFARRGKIGRCALVTPREKGWLCGTGCLRARLNETVVPEFLLQLFHWPVTVSWMVENAVGQTMPNLNTRILSDLPLLIPPLAEQRKIAQTLGGIDLTIDATKRVVEQTGTLKAGYLQHLLNHGVSPTIQRSPAECRGGDWSWHRIGELCTFVNGNGFKAAEWSDSGLPIIRIQNLNGSRDFNHFSGDPKPAWIVEPGDLLFAWAGVKGVSFGPRIWPGPRGVLNQHIYRVSPARGVERIWLFETLRAVTRHIEERAQGFKSSLQHLRKADITDFRVPVPPLMEQRVIAERSAFFAEMQTLEESHLKGLFRLKRALMDDFFTGQVSSA